MPGPRLEGRVSNPQPNRPVSGGTGLGDIAQLASVGVQAFQIHQEEQQKMDALETARDDAKVIIDFKAEMLRVNDSLSQGKLSQGEAAQRKLALGIQYAGVNPLLQEKIFKIAGNTGGAFGVISEDLDDARDQHRKRIENIQKDGEDIGLPIGTPISEVVYEVNKRREVTRRTQEITERNELHTAVGTSKRNDQTELGQVASVQAYNSVTDRWNKDYGISTGVSDTLSEGQKGDIKREMNLDYNKLRDSWRRDPLLADLTDEEVDKFLSPILDRKNLLFQIMDNKEKLDALNTQVIVAKAQAVANLQGTPEDQERIITINQLSQLPENAFINILSKELVQGIKDPEVKTLQDLLAKHVVAGYRKMGKDRGMGDEIHDDKMRSKYSNMIFSVFENILDVEGKKYSPSQLDNGASEINLITGTQLDMINQPERFDAHVWDSVMELGSRKYGEIIANNPSLSYVKENLLKQLVIIDSSLSASGNKHVQDGVTLEVVDGRIKASDPRASRFAERVGTALAARANMENRSYEDVLQGWRESNPKLFNDPIFTPTTELSNADELAIKIAVEQGYYPDTDTARREMGL